MKTETALQSSKKYIQLIEPIAGGVFTIIFLIVFNIVYPYLEFLSGEFDQLLPIYNFSLVLGAILNFSRVFFRSQLYKLVTDFVSGILFIYIAYQLWVIFPFNVSAIGDEILWTKIIKFLVIVPPIGYIISLVTNLIKLSSDSKQ